jgi:aryl-alcohol dehydrogenase-like predicted oxidoreductase
VRYRKFGRLNWNVSEIGFGMFGVGSWTGSNDEESLATLQDAVNLGCNFFDSAWGYGEGRTDRLLGELVRGNPNTRIYTATKVPPKNMRWPAQVGTPVSETFPRDHVMRVTEQILNAAGLPSMDLIQFHVWNDEWANDDAWLRLAEELKTEGLAGAIGISINRWEPANSLAGLRTGLIDAVQVIYNIFDQAPEDELFPLCNELDVAVICRVPLDEGTLTGTLTLNSSWPASDWRRTYFVPENLNASVEHAEALRPTVPNDMSMAEMALRFILSNPSVSTVIPGMRSHAHVQANIAASDSWPLPPSLIHELRKHRWNRIPTEWSQ